MCYHYKVLMIEYLRYKYRKQGDYIGTFWNVLFGDKARIYEFFWNGDIGLVLCNKGGCFNRFTDEITGICLGKENEILILILVVCNTLLFG